MARIHSFWPHILLLMSVYTATMMNAEPLIRSSKDRSPLKESDIVDNKDKNPYDNMDNVMETLYSDKEVNAALDDSDPVVMETSYSGNEVNAALIGYLKIMSDEKSVSGSIYIRWGRDECPKTAKIVYSGLAAAPDRDVTGGGGNYLCLPETPTYNNNSQPDIQSKRSIISTVKYRQDFPPFKELVDHDVPCAVCESIGRNTMLMMPASVYCPSDEWTLEYSGFLMAERDTHHRVQYVCIDGTPTNRSDKDQGVIFASMQPVEGVCASIGGLPCDKGYKNGLELACTVCTK